MKQPARLRILKVIKSRIWFSLSFLGGCLAYGAPQPFELTREWSEKIEALAPVKATAEPQANRRVLLFSLMTGFKHWVTPHTAEVIRILGRKTGAYAVESSDDVAMFEPERIKEFDVIVLNNNCSRNPRRDLFLDATGDAERAKMLEDSLIAHISGGKGLVAMHGAIVMQNNSAEFSRMLGGSFDFHPRQQEVTCLTVEPEHPLLKAFKGEPFVHWDEPYFFKNAYSNKLFRPLLEMDRERLGHVDRNRLMSDKCYAAWIKRYGEGRVFYCSPSHNAQSFEDKRLLLFILDGIQYAAGDLACDDSPPEQAK